MTALTYFRRSFISKPTSNRPAMMRIDSTHCLQIRHHQGTDARSHEAIYPIKTSPPNLVAISLKMTTIAFLIQQCAFHVSAMRLVLHFGAGAFLCVVFPGFCLSTERRFVLAVHERLQSPNKIIVSARCREEHVRFRSFTRLRILDQSSAGSPAMSRRGVLRRAIQIRAH